MALEPQRIALGTENRRVGVALLLQPKQAAVLWVEIEQKTVFDGQHPRNGGAVNGKPHDLVGAVAVVVDQMLGDPHWAADVIGGDRQAGQRVGGDFVVLRLDLSPGDLAVAVGIEPNGVIEIAQRDVPLSSQVIPLHRKHEVAVARLVGVSRRNA